MTSSRNRVALVTGANKGIGRAIAAQLADRGMTVLLGARDEQRGRAAADELRVERRDVRFIQLDVTNQASVDAAASEIAREFARLDVLVNNAAIAIEGGRSPSDVGPDLLAQTYATNVFGVVAVTHAMLPLLRRSHAARIVNLSSGLGSLTGAAAADGRGPNLLAYNSSKSAVNAITISYARELRDEGILVNAAAPGYVATDLNDHRGRLTPERGATVPVHLATLPEGGPAGTFVAENGTPTGEPAAW